MPFIILGLVIVHIILLHEHGSNNPMGSDGNVDKLITALRDEDYYPSNDPPLFENNNIAIEVQELSVSAGYTVNLVNPNSGKQDIFDMIWELDNIEDPDDIVELLGDPEGKHEQYLGTEKKEQVNTEEKEPKKNTLQNQVSENPEYARAETLSEIFKKIIKLKKSKGLFKKLNTTDNGKEIVKNPAHFHIIAGK